MDTSRLTPLSYVYISITLASWASSFIAIGLALDGFSPGSLAHLRFLVSGVIVTAVVLPRFGVRGFFSVSRRDLALLLVMAISGAALYTIFLALGQRTISSFGASVLINTAPIWTALFAVLLLHEELRARNWIGVLLGFSGAVLVASSGGVFELQLGGALLVLLAACCQGFYFVTLRSVIGRVGPARATAFTFLFAAAVTAGYLPSLAVQLPDAPPAATLAVIYLAIIPGGLGVWCWSQVAKLLPASQQAPLLYLVPPITALLAWWLVGETPGWKTAAGAVVTVFGASLVSREPTRS